MAERDKEEEREGSSSLAGRRDWKRGKERQQEWMREEFRERQNEKSIGENRNRERDEEGEIFNEGLWMIKGGEVDKQGMKMTTRKGESEE